MFGDGARSAAQEEAISIGHQEGPPEEEGDYERFTKEVRRRQFGYP